jgi:hypothetical protein
MGFQPLKNVSHAKGRSDTTYTQFTAVSAELPSVSDPPLECSTRYLLWCSCWLRILYCIKAHAYISKAILASALSLYLGISFNYFPVSTL